MTSSLPTGLDAYAAVTVLCTRVDLDLADLLSNRQCLRW